MNFWVRDRGYRIRPVSRRLDPHDKQWRIIGWVVSRRHADHRKTVEVSPNELFETLRTVNDKRVYSNRISFEEILSLPEESK